MASTIRKTAFTPTCIDVMDFFLENVSCYFTPYTASLSMGKSHYTVKDCMRVLYQSNYLTKFTHDGTVYYLTTKNMRAWIKDFEESVLGGGK